MELPSNPITQISKDTIVFDFNYMKYSDNLYNHCKLLNLEIIKIIIKYCIKNNIDLESMSLEITSKIILKYFSLFTGYMRDEKENIFLTTKLFSNDNLIFNLSVNDKMKLNEILNILTDTSKKMICKYNEKLDDSIYIYNNKMDCICRIIFINLGE